MRHFGEPLERGSLIRYLDIDDVREFDVGTLAGIVSAAKNGISDEPVRRHPEFREARADRGFEGTVGMIEREFDFAKT
jgi:hypothetical protein